MRNAFSQSLIRAALADPRVVLLTGDHGYALFDEFRARCPAQFINAGVAEQNMVGVAAGLAKGGQRPVVYGLASFVPMRVLEQIKLDVCYENLPIVLIGDGAGLVYSHLGASHQCTEDVAALRALPEMAILSPCDAHEMTSCMELALTANHPVYLRMGKADLGAVHLVRPVLDWGKLCLLKAGSGDLAWVATGSMVKTALALAEQWQGSAVWSAPCIKPLRPEQVRTLCGKHRALIVLEEHSVLGGLGSAMTEIVTTESPAWVLRVGVQDRFSQKCGSYGYLLQEHGLTPELIAQQVRRFVARMTSPGRRAA